MNTLGNLRQVRIGIWIPLLFWGALFMAGCADSNRDDLVVIPLSGWVTNGSGAPIAGATVYLVPAASVKTTAITTAGVLAGTSEAYDEPLEDLIAASGSTFPRATTDSNGAYLFGSVPGKYYVYVAPPAGSEYLPGGNACRVAKTLGGTVNVKLSSSPSAAATFVGSGQCVTCHADYAGHKYTAHKLGISVPGSLGALQDATNFPNYNVGIDLFKSVAAYTGGTVLSFGDYDSTKGFDKFEVYVGAAPAQIATKRGEAYLWKDSATSEYKITLVNTANPADPNTPLTLAVKLSYGGTVYKQRYLVAIPNTGVAPFNVARSGRYPLLQYQSFPGISDGADTNYARNRAAFRDYHLDWFYDDTTTLFKVPAASNTFEAQCAGCHIPGMTLQAANAEGERLADGIEDDTYGEFDIDGDGTKNEVNVGCETCHGPGSEHIAAKNARFIVTLGSLTPERETIVCGFCHDRPQGNGSEATLKKDVPYNASNEFPRAGISRADFLTNFTSRKGPKTGDMQADQIHSKSHHQQYSDLIKSQHYRNDRQLVVCSDCHDLHAYRTTVGLEEFPHNLKGDPDDPNSTLCMQCHAITPITHMNEKTGAIHAGLQNRCSDCHMPRTAASGPGMFGALLGAPTGASTDADLVYWMNDISSHNFKFVKKTWTGVAGTTPGNAMPAPYTNRCGTGTACHEVDSLKSLQPDSP